MPSVVTVPFVAQEAADFVRSVMDRIGVDGPTELAKRMGWGPNSPRKISRWLNGETAPDYDSMMDLLAAAGGYVPTATGEGGVLAQVEARMDAALNNQGKILHAVEELARAMDGLTDLVETSLTKAKPVPQRKRRTA